ncbi:MAG TPA: outer membrane beta-barrel protein [Burkholderiales bacterium]|nr:outer membrane beta-barrel protein [Burkholderiales bacterium]
MNIRHLFAIGLVAAATCMPAHAEVGPYFGAKGGFMDIDAGGHDKALAGGGVIGYRFFDDQRGSGALEAEATLTVKDGDIDGGGDWEATTIGFYFAYRSIGELYFKGKAGFVDQDIDGTGGASDDTTFSFGFGGGWQIDRKSALEVEYTSYDDLAFISVGFITRF